MYVLYHDLREIVIQVVAWYSAKENTIFPLIYLIQPTALLHPDLPATILQVLPGLK